MKCRFHAVTAGHHKKLPKGYQGYKLGRGTISGLLIPSTSTAIAVRAGNLQASIE
jgi:hypothetical protein